jgi:uncharacterized membrane protein
MKHEKGIVDDIVSGMTTAGAIALGAGVMYLADPDRGNRRRALVRDKMVRGLHELQCVADKGVRDLRNRAIGIISEGRASIRRADVDDPVLEERVRARLGRAVSHPGSIDVRAQNGKVTLSGPVLEAEADTLIDEVCGVRGVNELENRLELHKRAEDIPGLQGGGGARRGSRRPDFMQNNWAPATRLLLGGAGLLALGSSLRRGILGVPLGLGGGALLLRALTNIPIAQLAGAGERRRTISFQKTMEIAAPLEEVFDFWAEPVNFPQVMAHVKSVEKTSDGRYRFTIAGPAGSSASFDSEITQLVPNKLVAWRSVPGSLVRAGGVLRFQQSGDGTMIHILLSYNPPAGAVGHAIARLFSSDPGIALDDDMARFKSLMEIGKTRARGKRVRREQVAG